MKRAPLILGGIGSASGALLGAYLLARPRLHHWGATAEEGQRALPGDDIIVQPALNFTLAITIDAPLDAVWPWIVQLGQGRGGWYSYDWLENLMGLDIHTADRILPEFQHLAPGDVIPTGAIDIPVIDVEPPRLLLLGGAPFSTIAFMLEPLDEQRTRLLLRNRAALGWTPSGIFWRAVLDPGIFVMSRKMLLVLKQRAERAWHAQNRAGSATNAAQRSGVAPAWLLDRVRRFNKRTLNPAVLTFAGRPHSPYAVVQHVGRRSGRTFTTPVVAVPTTDGFVIPLPYGDTVDWCRNILAAKGCTIVSDGEPHVVSAPQVIDAPIAEPLLDRAHRAVFHAVGIKCYLLTHAAPIVEQAAREEPKLMAV